MRERAALPRRGNEQRLSTGGRSDAVARQASQGGLLTISYALRWLSRLLCMSASWRSAKRRAVGGSKDAMSTGSRRACRARESGGVQLRLPAKPSGQPCDCGAWKTSQGEAARPPEACARLWAPRAASPQRRSTARGHGGQEPHHDQAAPASHSTSGAAHKWQRAGGPAMRAESGPHLWVLAVVGVHQIVLRVDNARRPLAGLARRQRRRSARAQAVRWRFVLLPTRQRLGRAVRLTGRGHH